MSSETLHAARVSPKWTARCNWAAAHPAVPHVGGGEEQQELHGDRALAACSSPSSGPPQRGPAEQPLPAADLQPAVKISRNCMSIDITGTAPTRSCRSSVAGGRIAAHGEDQQELHVDQHPQDRRNGAMPESDASGRVAAHNEDQRLHRSTRTGQPQRGHADHLLPAVALKPALRR